MVKLEFHADVGRPPKSTVCKQMHLGSSYRNHMCPSQEILSEDKIMRPWGPLTLPQLRHTEGLFTLYFPEDGYLFSLVSEGGFYKILLFAVFLCYSPKSIKNMF